jgi:tRNA threonylcarbamoyladenosine biosynthesis protein TsaE
MLRFGEMIAKRIPPGSVVFLHGDLGAGKTTLVKGIISGLGCPDTVTSPTYTLVERYSVDNALLYHFDLYRLKTPDELELIGIRDMLDGEAISIFEWPERGAGILPEADIDILIEISGSGRVIEVPEDLAEGIQFEHQKVGS